MSGVGPAVGGLEFVCICVSVSMIDFQLIRERFKPGRAQRNTFLLEALEKKD